MAGDLTIAVDFDGTIVEHRYPDIGGTVPGAVECLKRLKALGCTLILQTMRSNNGPDGPMLDQAVAHCRAQGIEFDHVNCNPTQTTWTSSPKVYAHMYIDDAAVGCPLRPCARWNGRPVVDWERVEAIVLERIEQRRQQKGAHNGS